MSDASPLYTDPVLAAAYARITETNAANAAYERPAVRALLRDVAGRDVLDAGCAAGSHAAWLAARGAHVTAIDSSPAMVALAQERLGDRADVRLADLGDPLPFTGAAFDAVVCSLTLHYVRDWLPVLREFARVLRPRGRLVLSTHHPRLTEDDVEDYFAVQLVRDAWGGFGEERVAVQFYHRPLQRMVGDVLAAGFVLRGLYEPRPTAEADARDPALAARFRTRPGFLILDAETGAR